MFSFCFCWRCTYWLYHFIIILTYLSLLYSYPYECIHDAPRLAADPKCYFFYPLKRERPARACGMNHHHTQLLRACRLSFKSHPMITSIASEADRDDGCPWTNDGAHSISTSLLYVGTIGGSPLWCVFVRTSVDEVGWLLIERNY